MNYTDVWIVLVGQTRSGKTKLAYATYSFLADYLMLAKEKPRIGDEYRPYSVLYKRAHDEGLVKLASNLASSGPRSYYDTRALTRLASNNIPSIFSLSSIVSIEGTALETKSFVLKEVRGKYNLRVFDMLGQDFENFFHNFLLQKRSVLTSGDPNTIVRTLAEGFSEFLEINSPGSPLLKRLRKIKKVKDLKGLFEWSREVVYNYYAKHETILDPMDLTLLVLFDALLGFESEDIKTALLIVYGPESIYDRENLERLREFRTIAENIMRITSNRSSIGITHSKIDLVYKSFVERKDADPLDIETRKSFVDRYLSPRLSDSYAVINIHASVHEEEFSRLIQESAGIDPMPVEIPYSVLTPIYALFERAIYGRSSIPKDVYRKILPYPYAHIYFALQGKI